MRRLKLFLSKIRRRTILNEVEKSGIIIGINSFTSLSNEPNTGAYGTSKAAFHHLLQVAREEAKPKGIEILEAFIDETSFPEDDNEKMKKFFRDAARQLIVACNPLSCAHQLEFHIRFS